MDSSETTLIEFCAGYGGIGLGLGRVIENLRTIALCEIEGFAIENLIAKMEAGRIDACPIWNDLKTFPSKQFHGLVDILSAGFPCQPFSCAGLRRADDDPRHLFPYIMESVESIRPRFVFLENVEGLISAKLGSDCWADPIGTPVLLHVCRELERRGYTPTWGVFSASETGAPHQRKRVFVLAHSNSERDRAESGEVPPAYGKISDEEKLAHSSSEGLQWHEQPRLDTIKDGEREKGAHMATSECRNGTRSNLWPSRPREPQYWWEPPRVTGGQTQYTMGSNFNERTDILDRTLTADGSDGIVYKNTEGRYYATTQKTYAREVLQSLWNKIGTEELQRTFGRYEDVLAEAVLQSGVQLDCFTQRICFFIWCIQTCHKTQGWGLSGMWGNKASWDTPQGQEPIEQLRRELAYAMCQLSYEIALERGQESLETKGAMQDMWSSWEIKAWNVSEALPEMEEVWKSLFDQAFRKEWIYIEATHLGYNRVDELRLLGNGVVPATAAKAWTVLYDRLIRYE